ncbi:flavin-containing monooxygenase 5-like isoform X1 [Mytilus edulis]|uniref:flavin-containing monooxygenase 5-like isoform X1 n=2 Tax=Mytilus edulis TaxID=6550 RepID=UPI0039EFE157
MKFVDFKTIKMRVAVIGAGASGLTAIKCCIDEGLEPVCFERSNDIGGLWRYSDEVVEGQSCVMKSTVINTSKEIMCFSDFPIPSEYPMYMHNTYVQKYFNLYADKFNLRKYIRFETEVLSVSKHADFAQSGQWVIKLKDKKSTKVREDIFDAVIVCSGHHAEKNVPDFPGLSNFKGKVIHSHDYRHQAGFEDKRIVVIGIGNSGGDMAVELSRVASQVFISTRRGSWVFNRIADNGMPVDMIVLKRSVLKIRKLLPPSFFDNMMENQVNKRFDHSTYCLKPKHRITAQHPTINDDIPNRLASGTLKAKPDIKTFTENGVIFDDSTKEENIDVVVLATGYIFGFPFLDKSVLDVKQNHVELFKYVFPPKLEQSTLCVIGCIQPIAALMPISELQCRLATRVFQGKVKLPCYDEMMTDIKNKELAMQLKYVQTQRHTIQVDYIDYMDELATLNGCLPDLKSLLWSDPILALNCYFGPCTPYQYRLNGPCKWSGARQAILTQWDRTFASLKTRPLGSTEPTSQKKFLIFYFVLAVVFCFFYTVYNFYVKFDDL